MISLGVPLCTIVISGEGGRGNIIEVSVSLLVIEVATLVHNNLMIVKFCFQLPSNVSLISIVRGMKCACALLVRHIFRRLTTLVHNNLMTVKFCLQLPSNVSLISIVRGMKCACALLVRLIFRRLAVSRCVLPVSCR